MGTNFYARKIPTIDDINQFKETIRKNTPTEEEINERIENGKTYYLASDYEEASYEISRVEKQLFPRVHLGKRSYGWQFLWQYHNGQYYEDNLESIRKFLSSGEYEIYNEYGEKFSVDDFFGDEIAKVLYKTDELWDLKSYYEKEQPNYYGWQSHLNDEWTSKDGLRFCKVEFS